MNHQVLLVFLTKLHFHLVIPNYALEFGSKASMENLQLDGLTKDDNLTLGFSGNISMATTDHHNHVVVCAMMSPMTCSALHRIQEEYHGCREGFFLRTLDSKLCTHILYFDPFVLRKLDTPEPERNETVGLEMGKEFEEYRRSLGNPKVLLQTLHHSGISILSRKKQGMLKILEIPDNKIMRKLFITEIMDCLRVNHLDGLDIGLLLPNAQLNASTTRKTAKELGVLLPLLMGEIRTAFKDYGYLLTVSLYGDARFIQVPILKFMNYHHILRLADQVHIMNPYHLPVDSAFRKTVLVHNHVLERMIEVGCPPSKIVLGISTIGTFQEDLGNEGDDATETFKYLEYFKVNPFLVNHPTFDLTFSSANHENVFKYQICQLFKSSRDEWTPYYSREAFLSVITSDTGYIGFESTRSVIQMVKFGLQQGVKGFAVDSVSHDDLLGIECGPSPVTFPILRTINYELSHRSQSSLEIHHDQKVPHEKSKAWHKRPVALDKKIVCLEPSSYTYYYSFDLGYPNDTTGEFEFPACSSCINVSTSEMASIFRSTCSEISIAGIIGVEPRTLQMNRTFLNRMMSTYGEAFLATASRDYWDSHLTLTVVLILPHGEGKEHSIDTIGFPERNRRKFVNGIVYDLLEYQLDGIELMPLAVSATRTAGIFYLILQDLRKRLSPFGLSLTVYIRHGNIFGISSLDVGIVAKLVDYVNMLPQPAVLIPSESRQPSPSSIIKEGVNSMIAQGVPAHKIIVVFPLSAIQYFEHGGEVDIVTRNAACLRKEAFPQQWLSTGVDGLELVSDGHVWYIYESEKLQVEGIEAAIDAGVAGFKTADIGKEGEKYCASDKQLFWTLRTINRLLSHSAIKKKNTTFSDKATDSVNMFENSVNQISGPLYSIALVVILLTLSSNNFV